MSSKGSFITCVIPPDENTIISPSAEDALPRLIPVLTAYHKFKLWMPDHLVSCSKRKETYKERNL